MFLSFKTKLETTMPSPNTIAIRLIIKPTYGIRASSHSMIEDATNIPKVAIVFSIFSLLQIKLFIVITKIEVLIASKAMMLSNSNKPTPDVIPKMHKIIAKKIPTIGTKMPNKITGITFFVVNKDIVFFKNLGASHKHINQTTATITTKDASFKI